MSNVINFKKTEVSVLMLLKATVKNIKVFLFLFYFFNQASYIRQDSSPRELNTKNFERLTFIIIDRTNQRLNKDSS